MANTVTTVTTNYEIFEWQFFTFTFKVHSHTYETQIQQKRDNISLNTTTNNNRKAKNLPSLHARMSTDYVRLTTVIYVQLYGHKTLKAKTSKKHRCAQKRQFQLQIFIKILTAGC